jgi:molybdopterin-guanine dinucleotide biosynthesis protein A
MLAVDLPFIEPSFLRYLVEQAEASQAIVTVPRTAAGWQPLCAVYRRSFADLAEQAVAAGRNKIDALFAGLSLRVIDEAELKQAGFSPEIFVNVNTPEDFASAERSISKSPS